MRWRERTVIAGWHYLVCWTLLLANPVPFRAADVIVIGDSLSAEYETIPSFPGTDNPTAYAQITVEGWESMSWVEVLARLRSDQFHFGAFRNDLLGWGDLRFSGYEYNFAVPGFTADQFEEIVTSSLFSNPLFWAYRSILRGAIKNEADRVVVWLGANEFRASFGFLADGGDPAGLINELIEDLDEVIEFVQDAQAGAEIVIANLPDLSAAPDKKQSRPDPAQRALVTAATQQANERIAQLAARKGIAVADVFSQSAKLVARVSTFLGAVQIIDDMHADNDPHYQFTRDGLHPNTPSQIEIARVIIETFNRAYNAGLAQITDAEALSFLGIDPLEPFHQWVAAYELTQGTLHDDPDGDGLPNLVEFAFGSDPGESGPFPATFRMEGSEFIYTFTPSATADRLVQFTPQQSADLVSWKDIPAEMLTVQADGTVRVQIDGSGQQGFLRLKLAVRDYAEER